MGSVVSAARRTGQIKPCDVSYFAACPEANLKINAEFDRVAIADSEDVSWQASPMPGVDRRMLERVGDEVARATSVVRYAPGSQFSPHVHTGGEEFLVLDGIFQDEYGDFPVGSYIRNPPGSRHTPGSEPGCTIFVKLQQFDPDDDSHVRIDCEHLLPIPHRDHEGLSVVSLFHGHGETVSIYEMIAHVTLHLSDTGGVELFILSGSLLLEDRSITSGGWLRIPSDRELKVRAGVDGVRFWIKTGHLTAVDAQLKRLEGISGS